MCYPEECPTCKKVSWGGCGKHLSSVFAKVTVEDRCSCGWDPKVRTFARMDAHGQYARTHIHAHQARTHDLMMWVTTNRQPNRPLTSSSPTQEWQKAVDEFKAGGDKGGLGPLPKGN